MKNINNYNVVKFQSPFEKLKKYELNPETRLYKSIIIQAIIDVSNKADNLSLKRDELEAKNWLFGNTVHFLNICKRAELEPNEVIKLARVAISLNQSYQFYHTDKISVDRENLKSIYDDKEYLLLAQNYAS